MTPLQALGRMAVWAVLAGLLAAGVLASSHELVFALQGWLQGWGPPRG